MPISPAQRAHLRAALLAALEEQAARDHAARDHAAREQAAREWTGGEWAGRDQATQEWAGGERAGEKQAGGPDVPHAVAAALRRGSPARDLIGSETYAGELLHLAAEAGRRMTEEQLMRADLEAARFESAPPELFE